MNSERLCVKDSRVALTNVERAGRVCLADVRVSWATDRAYGNAAGKSTLEVAADDKCNKYEPLASEIRRHTGMPVVVLPLVFGSSCIVPKRTRKAVKELVYGIGADPMDADRQQPASKWVEAELSRLLHKCASSAARHTHDIWISHQQMIRKVHDQRAPVPQVQA